MKLNTTYRCIRPYIANSFPNNYIIDSNEYVELVGYMMEKPLIKLDNKKHPSAYKHLPDVQVLVDPEKFNEHFEIANID